LMRRSMAGISGRMKRLERERPPLSEAPAPDDPGYMLWAVQYYGLEALVAGSRADECDTSNATESALSAPSGTARIRAASVCKWLCESASESVGGEEPL
jgi:hypothetical protein